MNDLTRVRQHKGYGHGLRPGTDHDMNCPSCQRDRAAGITPVIEHDEHDGDSGMEIRSMTPFQMQDVLLILADRCPEQVAQAITDALAGLR
jgi:hypothetical protein